MSMTHKLRGKGWRLKAGGSRKAAGVTAICCETVPFIVRRPPSAVHISGASLAAPAQAV